MYNVKKGDTLYSISKKFNISISELIELNNISNNNLSIGQSLKVNKK
jgi:LysM repeat protein